MTPSRSRAPSLWRAATFRWVLGAAAAFVLTTIGGLWLWGLVVLDQIERQEMDRLAEFQSFALELFEAEGIETLALELHDEDGNQIWEDDLIYELLENEEIVAVLRDDDWEAVAGYPGLWEDDANLWVWLDHPEIDTPLFHVWFELDDGFHVTLGSFVPERQFVIQELLLFFTIAILAIVAPLSLIVGLWLSTRVYGRIARLSETADLVGAGDLSQRAPMAGTMDEFDHLSGGINRMLDQIQTLTSNIEAVSVGVAHDLKTPLANIGGRLELMRRDLNDGAVTEAHIAAAEGYLSQVLRIFDALLRLGEVEAGRRKSGFAPLSLSELVGDMTDAYGAVFDDVQKTLTATVAPDVTVLGDRELLEQLLSNLLENALEHSRDAAQVFVSLSVSGETALLRLGDDGPGIPPADQARIFDRFYRADRSRSTPGSGLGLALVKAIAGLHDADLTLEAGTKGAVFALSFPVHPE